MLRKIYPNHEAKGPSSVPRMATAPRFAHTNYYIGLETCALEIARICLADTYSNSDRFQGNQAYVELPEEVIRLYGILLRGEFKAPQQHRYKYIHIQRDSNHEISEIAVPVASFKPLMLEYFYADPQGRKNFNKMVTQQQANMKYLDLGLTELSRLESRKIEIYLQKLKLRIGGLIKNSGMIPAPAGSLSPAGPPQ